LKENLSQPPPQRTPRWSGPAVCLGLAAITLVVFGQTLRHQFIDFDDNDYVYENPMVAQGLTLKGIVWAFSFHAANWHPLTWLSHELDCQLYELHPLGHHLTNVLLHTATVIALFLALRRMTGALWRSAFVAAVFAIHPLRVESVAWVAERKDVLSGLFFMLTIWAYVRYTEPRKLSESNFKFFYALTAGFFALGLMCKPMLVTLPLVLLLLDYWPLRRGESAGKLLVEKLPLLALSAAACVATLLAQSSIIELTASFSLPLRLANALVACMVYLGQMLWPAGLAPYYPYASNGPWKVALAGALLAGLSLAAFWRRRQQPWMLVGWCWFLVMLLPVVGIIQVGRQAHADRYTYLPQIGLYVALTWLAAEWGAHKPARRAPLAVLMIGALAALMACAWQQTTYWRNSETLWNHTLACTTNNDEAHYALGNAFFENGKLNEAIAQFQKALQIRPERAEAHYNLGIALYQQGEMDQAIAHFQKALQINPAYAQAHNNLGGALLQEDKLDEAIPQFQAALQLDPNAASPHLNLGIALFQKGKVDEAIGHFRAALQLRPAYAAAHYNLGNALAQKGLTAEAISHYRAALQIEPADAEAQNNLAWLMATCAQASLRDGTLAVELARQANALTGGANPLILHTLAAALAEAGKFSEATQTAQKALELARAARQQDLVEQLNGELKRYGAGLPFHQ
jgi:tetratricopeptide (TPR) repeat protein